MTTSIQVPTSGGLNDPTVNKLDTTIRFSKAQVDWLEKQFPERVSTAQMSNEEIRHGSAQRSVILEIKRRASV